MSFGLASWNRQKKALWRGNVDGYKTGNPQRYFESYIHVRKRAVDYEQEMTTITRESKIALYKTIPRPHNTR